ncbi:MAG: 30S ribosomal protein S6 [Bacteroidetes bacterium]|nr:30S ribosomal protein S6 [Bacteroidota bacterium]
MDITPKSFKNEYETTFILIPDLPEGDHRKAVDKYVQLIKDNDGEVHNIEHWGMRKLAYPIEKKTSGYYAYFEFKAPADFIAKLEQTYRYDVQVIRYLTVKLDKHHLAFNVKRREQGFGLRKEATKQK